MKTITKVIIAVVIIVVLLIAGVVGFAFYYLNQVNGDYNYAIQEGAKLKTSSGDVDPAEGCKFVVVSFEVHNNADALLVITDSNFKLKNPEGTEFKISSKNGDYIDHKSSIDPLSKDQNVCYNVVFEVPVGEDVSKLTPDYVGLGKMNFNDAMVVEKIYKPDGSA